MDRTFWADVAASDFAVPAGHPVAELTDDLVAMLGDPDPSLRDELAYPALCGWISGGVYDGSQRRDLGGRMCDGMMHRLGETGTDSVVQRTFSALILGELVDADLREPYLTAGELRAWRDTAVEWFVAERDLRGLVPGLGWTHAVAHGADLLLALARSPHLAEADLAGLLQAIAYRLAGATSRVLIDAEDERLGYATMAVLLRDRVPAGAVRDWLRQCTDGVSALQPGDEDYPARVNTISYLRALYFQLLNGVRAMPGMPQPQFFDHDPAGHAAILAELNAALGRLELGFWRARSGQ